MGRENAHSPSRSPLELSSTPALPVRGDPEGIWGRGAGGWVGRWSSSWRWRGQVTAGPERRGLGRSGGSKEMLQHLRGTRPTSSGLARSGDRESDLGHPGSGAERGKSGNDIRGLCSGRGGPRRAGAAGRGREDLGGAFGPGAGPGPLPGGVSCRVRPPRLSPPPLWAAPCMVWAPRSPRPLPPPSALRPSPAWLSAARDRDAESVDPVPRRPPETRRASSGPR